MAAENLPKNSRSKGFSLVELLIVLAIIAILATIAAPSYREIIDSSKMTFAANNLLGALQFARSEAIMRKKEIRVCPGASVDSCDSSDWSVGGVVLDGGVIIRHIPPAPGIRITSNNANKNFAFDRNGRNPYLISSGYWVDAGQYNGIIIGDGEMVVYITMTGRAALRKNVR